MAQIGKGRAAKKVKTLPPVVQRREPTAAEQAAIAQARELLRDLPERCEMAFTDDSAGRTIASPHSDIEGYSAQLMTSFGSCSIPFVDEAIVQLVKVSGERGKQATQKDANAALAFISAVGPTNELECAMALQLHGTNALALELLSRARNTDDRLATVEYTNLATKLSRTFTAQVEALAKLRRNGEQVVKHVHVYEGGQAVVAGTINQGGRVIGKGSGQPHEQAAHAPFTALPGADEAGNCLSIASDAERAVPHPRG